MSKYIIEIPDDVQYVLLNGKADNKYYTAVRPVAELEVLNSDYINENFGELQDEAYKQGYAEAERIWRAPSSDNEFYQKGLEDGKKSTEKGCDGCEHENQKEGASPCCECARVCDDYYIPKRSDRIEVWDEAYQKGINDGSLDVKQRVEGAYQSGLEDAWEAAKKIVVDTDHGGLASGTLYEIFGTRGYSYIMQENTAQEAIAKLKVYEDKRSDRIEVGDEVEDSDGDKTIVTNIHGNLFDGLCHDGSVMSDLFLDDNHKTGKHYDIASILEAMRK